jgi:hypothetical protein
VAILFWAACATLVILAQLQPKERCRRCRFAIGPMACCRWCAIGLLAATDDVT